jgi:hypothetical protein
LISGGATAPHSQDENVRTNIPDSLKKQADLEGAAMTRQRLSYQGGRVNVCTYSRLENERVAEVFISNHKSGTHADACARDCAIAASLALQFGCPVETLRNALLRDSRGRAATPLGRALDLISEFRESG